MKNSFVLLFTLILIFIFSLLCTNIFETKAIASTNIINQHKYIQAKNHLKFLEEYILYLPTLESINKIEIPDESFNISANIKRVDKKYEIEMIVKNLDSDIRVYKKIIK
ncbi:hypothetical protein [Halarcobacter ebronensis]|uniref:Uncharacterized protein n=1 Tax=Halarcobacter ebronensis TaxID=1462615 RepID=A0A4Q1AJU6_9BACT|nr:hypothetical protein [Halarcobacter ebronensis]QKF81259.1 hypothetical protein AEBR_0759 [Halarcobacter ebronensis]RXK04825.1 hypothetical protein CRV07_09555 [Halarcobacter ebronensis]